MSTINILDSIDNLRSLINSYEMNIPEKYYTGKAKPQAGMEAIKGELLGGLDLVEFIERKIDTIIHRAEQRTKKKRGKKE